MDYAVVLDSSTAEYYILDGVYVFVLYAIEYNINENQLIRLIRSSFNSDNAEDVTELINEIIYDLINLGIIKNDEDNNRIYIST